MVYTSTVFGVGDFGRGGGIVSLAVSPPDKSRLFAVAYRMMSETATGVWAHFVSTVVIAPQNVSD